MAKFSTEEWTRMAREIAASCAGQTGQWLVRDVSCDAGAFVGSKIVAGYVEAGLVIKLDKRRIGAILYQTTDVAGLLAIANGADIPLARHKGGRPAPDLGMNYKPLALAEVMGLVVRPRGTVKGRMVDMRHNKEPSDKAVSLPLGGTVLGGNIYE